MALVEARCPTFSWAAVDGARSHDLVVYEVDAMEAWGAEGEPVLQETLAGGVTTWTPSLGACLERGGRYAWSVRANRSKGLTEWSEASFFQVASEVAGPEYRKILEAVQRLLLAEEAAAGLGESDDELAREAEIRLDRDAEVGTRAAPGLDTQLLVNEGHIAVRRNGEGYVQLDTRANTAPHASYCDHITDTGRMILRVGSTRGIYVCTTNGVTPAFKFINLP